jgi:hypothetical protein
MALYYKFIGDNESGDSSKSKRSVYKKEADASTVTLPPNTPQHGVGFDTNGVDFVIQ